MLLVSCKPNKISEQTAVKDTINITTDTLVREVTVIPADIDTAAELRQIDRYTDSISKLQLRSAKMDFFGLSAEGGTATIYISNTDTVKMTGTAYGETGKSEFIFFLKKGRVISYEDIISYYKEPISGNGKIKIASVSTLSYKFRDGHLLSFSKDGRKATPDFDDTAADVSKIYRNILNNAE